MSLYDTENLMQKASELLGNNNLLLNAELFSNEIEEACAYIKKAGFDHYYTASKYAKVHGNTARAKMDMILGIDDIMEVETEDGDMIFVAIDWTDNPLKLEEKRVKMASRRKAFDILGIDLVIAVSVVNQVRVDRKVEKAKFASSALFEITLKAEDMKERGKYCGTLELNMKELVG